VSVLLRATVPAAALSQVALLGRNFADEEARAVGLVDDLAYPENFEEVCLGRLAEFADKDPGAFGTTKLYLRAEALRSMKAQEAESAAEFLDAWFAPASRERLQQMIEALGKR
jgi:enoyl-CoA hydratase/carnithine racemase